MKSLRMVFVISVLLLLHYKSWSDIPQLINFQGVLKDAGGNPVANDTVAVLFKIYDQESGGSVKWSEDDTVITDANGLFNILLGYKTPIPDSSFNGASRWLGMKIGADAELDPRTQLVSVPYSYLSDTTQASAGGGGGWVDDGGVVRLENGSDEVGIGTASPAGKLDVTGYIIARRGDGLQDAITIDPLDPNAAIELRSGTTGGTPFIDFANDDSTDFDGRIRLTGNNILAVEGVPNVTLRVIGKTETDSFKLPTSPSAGYVLTSDAIGVGTWQSLPGGPYLPLAGGTMTGQITNTGNPSINMGKGNFGSGNANPGANAFVAGENDTASGDWSTVGGGRHNITGVDDTGATVAGGSQNTADGDYASIGGGLGNAASSDLATISGGINNISSQRWATVGGGIGNIASDSAATVGGGSVNSSSNKYATVSGGRLNVASGNWSAVGGGENNTASGSHSTVAGGESNKASQSHATVGGGQNNKAASGSATVAGGENNQSNNSASTVGGGLDNTADGQYSTVAGGRLNLADLHYATVSGGYNNQANDTAATIAGGRNNRARGRYSSIGGGGGVDVVDSNSAQGDFSAISGGQQNTTIGTWATIGGGFDNKTTFTAATIAGGGENTADYWATVGGGFGDSATGQFSTVPGGRANKASGNYSFAAGRKAKAEHSGAFVWGDSTNTEVTSDTTNQFKIRASNGVSLTSNLGAKDYEVGELYRNNLIVAWGNINADGSIGESFGLSGPLGKPGTGEYTVAIEANAANASALIPVASAEVDAIPTTAATARLIYVDQLTSTTFRVYITNGSFSAVDNEFTFIVTAR